MTRIDSLKNRISRLRTELAAAKLRGDRDEADRLSFMLAIAESDLIAAKAMMSGLSSPWCARRKIFY